MTTGSLYGAMIWSYVKKHNSTIRHCSPNKLYFVASEEEAEVIIIMLYLFLYYHRIFVYSDDMVILEEAYYYYSSLFVTVRLINYILLHLLRKGKRKK